MNAESAEMLQKMIDDSSRIVFFGGAGVSTESGIPDFRSRGGLFSQKYKYPPRRILSKTFYRSKPEEFYRFYRDRMVWPDAKPNLAHRKLAELEAAGKVRGCVCRLEKGDAEIACEPVEAGDPAVRAVFETVGRGFRLLSEGYGAHVRCIADGEEDR